MKKLILGPLLILGIPQVLVSLFFLFVRAMLGWTSEARNAYVVITGIVLVLTTLVAGICLVGSEGDGWISDYTSEQSRLLREREKLRQKLDEEIGIPRLK